MRIIVTNNGIFEISPLSRIITGNLSQTNVSVHNNPWINSYQCVSIPQLSQSQSAKLLEPINTNLTRTRKTKKENTASPTVDSRSITNLSARNISTVSAQIVKVNHKIPGISKEILDWYSQDKENASNIVKHSSDIYTNILTRSQSTGVLTSKQTLPYLPDTFKIKEIIAPQTFEKWKQKIKNDQFIESHDHIVNYNNFRKPNQLKDIIGEIDKNTEKPISATNNNWIDYWIGKTTVTDKFINNLHKYDKERLSKLNKICQTVWHKKKTDENIKLSLKFKLESKRLKEQQEWYQNLRNLNNRMVISYNRLQSNELLLRGNKKNSYNSLLNSFKEKYWNKNNNFRHLFKQREYVAKETKAKGNSDQGEGNNNGN